MTLYWPQDGTALANTNYTWRGWVDDPLATVTAQTVDTHGVTNTYTGIVERNGNFWIENLTLTGATNGLSLSVTDSAGNSATTNITIVASPVLLTIQPPTADLWNKFINVYGTINDTSDYTVWVNGVQAVITNGTWAATNVYLPDGGTALIQARAIPNTDHGGNGTGGNNSPSIANPGNPSSSSAGDAELQINKPAEIVISSEYYQDHQILTPTNGTSTQDIQVTWNRDEPYDVMSQHTSIRPGYNSSGSSDQTCPAWPESDYDGEPVNGTITGQNTINGVTTNYSGPGADPWFPDDVFCQMSGTVDAQYEKTTQIPKYTLHTGGKGAVDSQSIFQLSCGATEILDLFYTWLEAPILPQEIQMMGQTLDADGYAYIALADNTSRDATPKINKDYYEVGPGATKNTVSLLLNGKDVTDKQMGDELNPVIAGRLYTLNCTISPGLPTNMTPTYQWQPSSDMLTDWVWTSTNSQKIYITNATNSSLTFGWYKGGSKTVSCTVTFPDGTVLNRSTSANVVKPTTTIQVINKPSVVVGTDWTWASGPAIYYGTGGNDLELFYSTPSVSVGTYSWLQIGNISRTDTFSSSTSNNVGSGLDGSFPCSVDGNGHFHDEPGESLSTGLGEVKASAADSFKTYIMFKPSGGFYVPICLINWSWGGTAVPDTNSPCGWSLVPGSASAPMPSGGGETSEYPTWTDNTSNVLNH